ncbi:AfsR/SARP family transcriptional regulator [Kibdelosporangium persicum]|uniref:AfsR/SARP family transcriptional regulator n=1 Tax=Kibdelosporangium persicum TaxID=2698649 RepID=UPI0015663EEF|nr:BTAD domain-containing putative transcriptional regulator [Kibdelosporangium persicum]
MELTTVLSFDVLGPVRGRYRGRGLELGPARQSALLGVMLTRPNVVFSPDELLHSVWGDRVPKSANKVIPTYIYRLRQALRVTGEEAVIERIRNGYALRIEADAVDATHFARATESMDAATMMSADDQYGQVASALEMWRGEPFEGLPGPALASERAKLHEMRLALLMHRAGLDIVGGNYAAAVLDLSDLQERNPMHERVACLLMIALYQSGRQAESLAVYSRIRLRLLDELGSEPGAALVTTHQAVLTGDQDALDRICGYPLVAAPVKNVAEVSVDAPRPSFPAEAVVPRQLPLPLRHFAGRGQELAALDQVGRATGHAFCVIVGTGGMGKTSLALYWAHRHADRFPDGQLFVDLRGFSAAEPVAVSTVLCGFLDALGVDPAHVPGDIEAQAALYRSVVAGRRMLIVLDNARDADQVVPLLPGTPRCAVLVTSRNRLIRLIAQHGAHPLPVDALSAADARQVLLDRLGEERLAAEPEAVADLLAHGGGFPLALGILTARAQSVPGLPLASLASELRDAPTRLASFDDEDRGAALPAVLSWSYARLTAEQAQMFVLLGLAPGPDIGLNAAANLVGVSAVRARTTLRGLEDAHLVRQHVAGRYRMHELVKLYAASRAEHDLPADVRPAALRRLVDFYLRTAHSAEHLLEPHSELGQVAEPSADCVPELLDDLRAAWTWFVAEHPVLPAIQRLAAEHGWHAQVWQLAWTADTFHRRRGRRDEAAIAMWQAGLDSAVEVGELAVEISVRRRLGQAYTRAARLDDATLHLGRALSLAEQAEDVLAQAHAHRALAQALDQQGDAQAALDQATQALRLFSELGHQTRIADMLNAVGWYRAKLGHYTQGRTYCEAALTLARRLRHRTVEAGALHSIGYVLHHTGEHTNALRLYEQAQDLYHDIGHVDGTADALEGIGHVYQALGQDVQARDAWQRVAELYATHHRTEDRARIQRLMANLDNGSR